MNRWSISSLYKQNPEADAERLACLEGETLDGDDKVFDGGQVTELIAAEHNFRLVCQFHHHRVCLFHTVFFLKLIPVQKLHVNAAVLLERFPSGIFPEGPMGQAAEEAVVGLRAHEFMADISYRTEHSAIGIIDKDQFHGRPLFAVILDCAVSVTL